MYKPILILLIIALSACNRANFSSKWINEKAPDKFTARFETSKGNFEVEVTRSFSPLAVDRFYQTVRHHYFDNVLVYRVVPNFVVQFGNTDTLISRPWEKQKVPDEPLIKSNIKGTLSYARSGPETRGTDLFINLKDNLRLDTIKPAGVVGYPGIGTVTRGMDVVEAMYSGYGNKTLQAYDSLAANRAKYLALFPLLDSIKRAYIVR